MPTTSRPGITSSKALRLGINYPWVSCGHDFGPRPPAWGGDGGPRDFGEVERELAELQELGLDIARYWILAGGVNYPVGVDPTELGRLQQTADGPVSAVASAALGKTGRSLAQRLPAGTRYLSFELRAGASPPELPEQFLRDFEALLTAAGNAGVQLLPSLLSFELFQPAIVLDRNIVKRGRKAFVFGNPDGPSQLDTFLDRTLTPLLEVSASQRRSLFGWEVINEPEWAVEGGPLQVDPRSYGWVPTTHWVTRPQMSALIGQAVRRIVDAGFMATVGFEDSDLSWLSDDAQQLLRTLSATNEYLHQRHHYPTMWSDHTLPRHADLELGPCMLGEFPTAPGGKVDNIRWRDEALRRSESDPDRYLEERLRLMEDRGYPVALLWSARSGDNRRAWGPSQRQQVARVTGATT